MRANALTPRHHVVAGAALLLVASSSCMRVEVTYRDVGQPDAWRADAARTPTPDAAIDAPRTDANDLDAPPIDAPRSDAPLPTSTPEATRAVLAAIGENVILASARDFELAADRLVTATAAARASGSPASIEAAREAWRDAMNVWERAEVVQVGPAGLPLYALGGRGLRDEIHAWPLVSYCRMDQSVVEGSYASADTLSAEPASARGLSAIEYTLFESTGNNRCPATATINTGGAWSGLGAAEVQQRRLVYAHNASILVAERARQLRNAWEPSGENFLGTFSTAGAGSTLYRTAQAGLNGLSDAMFYLYKDVVDYKIGIPAGIYVDCPTDTCPDNVEAPFADASLDFIRINILAFRDAYLGGPPPLDAPGFDDLLRAVGAGELDARIQAQVEVALAALEPVLSPLELAVDLDREDVATLHRECRALADLFRIEVLTILDLELPNRVEGDND